MGSSSVDQQQDIRDKLTLCAKLICDILIIRDLRKYKFLYGLNHFFFLHISFRLIMHGYSFDDK